MKPRKELEMKPKNQLIKTFFVVAFLLLATPVTVFGYESIRNFESEITLHQDGSFTVEETIQYDFDVFNKHGIFRTIPLTHAQDASAWYKSRVIKVDVQNVQLNRSSVPFNLSESGNELKVKIGDPDVTITGIQEYRISYRVEGGLSYYDNGDPELYWEVTGTDWEVPILVAKATVYDPDNITTDERACYRGSEGGSLSCDLQSATSSLALFSTSNLAPGEGLTIAEALDETKVDKKIIETTKPLFIWVPILLVLLAAFTNWLYRTKTKHKISAPVIAEYEPYPEALPMYSGVLFDGQLDPKDITAGLIYLAEQGFIKIRKTERKAFYLFEVDDYEVELLKVVEDLPTNFHDEVLSLLFASFTPGEKVLLSSLKKDTGKQKANQRVLIKLKTAIAKDVEERGFYEQVIKFKFILPVLVIVIAAFVLLGKFMGEFIAFVIIGTIVVLGLTLAVIYRRRTRKGYEALNHLKGFKDFLSVTGQERFKFHDSPEKNPEKFLEYLPYAVALGVEKEWAEVFKDVTIPNPGWYDGGGASFNAVALTNNLGAFSTAFASSSGSSGTSGSSGGGSVGGGSGGGGGGSW